MKRRRIYYVPGMISLICLPVLCIWYLNEHKNFLRVLEISYAAKYIPNHDYKNQIRFDTTSLSLPENKRKYYDVTIYNNEKNNSQSYYFIEKKLDQIIKTKNKTTGIHVLFSDNSNYGSYIKTIDIIERCFKRNSAWHTYCPYTNNIWILYINDRKEVVNNSSCYNLTKQESMASDFSIISLMKIWPFIILFILFSIISIRYIKDKTTK